MFYLFKGNYNPQPAAAILLGGAPNEELLLSKLLICEIVTPEAGGMAMAFRLGIAFTAGTAPVFGRAGAKGTGAAFTEMARGKGAGAAFTATTALDPNDPEQQSLLATLWLCPAFHVQRSLSRRLRGTR